MSTATTMPQHQFCLPGIEEPHRDGVAYLDELVREAGGWLASLVEFLHRGKRLLAAPVRDKLHPAHDRSPQAAARMRQMPGWNAGLVRGLIGTQASPSGGAARPGRRGLCAPSGLNARTGLRITRLGSGSPRGPGHGHGTRRGHISHPA